MGGTPGIGGGGIAADKLKSIIFITYFYLLFYLFITIIYFFIIIIQHWRAWGSTWHRWERYSWRQIKI